MSKTTIEIYRDARQKYRWRITARNGRIIAASTQGYKSRQRCLTNLDDTARAADRAIKHLAFKQEHPERAFTMIDSSRKVAVVSGG